MKWTSCALRSPQRASAWNVSSCITATAAARDFTRRLFMWQPRATGVRWEWIGEAWHLFAAQAVTWILMMVMFVIAIVIPFLPIIFALSATGILASDQHRADWGTLLAGLGLTLVLLPVAAIVM